ncbi:MAG: hypothetical protein HQL69_11585 [Magnetococcales bacterium]|nr:hypothetical protein [Magnetococcales bacterium]
MGNFFRSGGGLFIPSIANVGWLRSLLWRWDTSSQGNVSLAERMKKCQTA